MFTPEKILPSAADIKKALPLPVGFKERKENAIKQIRNILSGADKRKLFLVGPCSADDPSAVIEYAQKLSRVAEKVKDKIYTVMRVYTAKPRTRGEGYMGIVHNPAGNTVDISAGLFAVRKLHLDVANISGLFTADEMLYTDMYPYIDDVVSYMTVGARSAEDQMHRFVAGGADVPVGIKNPLSGNPIDHADCVHAARVSSTFAYCGRQVVSSGNKYAHAVFRGGVDRRGGDFCNYEPNDILKAREAFILRGVDGIGAIVDTGHANSEKNPNRVGEIVNRVISSTVTSPEYGDFVKGVMIESYLFCGSKAPFSEGYGVSVTDPCVGIEETEQIMLRAAAIL